jgi:hypothetical protein
MAPWFGWSCTFYDRFMANSARPEGKECVERMAAAI